jgi:leucyl-tRNA synthetase
MGPLDASKPWTTRDIVGVIRFLQRLWRNHVDPDTGEMLVTEEQPNEEISRLLHKTIRQVTEDMGHLSFNTALARMFELNNALVPLDRIPRAVSEAFVRILSPLAPHICEELWERLGHEPSISTASWPDFDDALAADETVTMVVQVNGKVRDRIEVPVDITEGSARELALGSEKVQSLLAGAEPRRVIVRPPSLVNVVQ